jgi:hypothetical protein
MKSKFKSWFKKQFGGLPDERKLYLLYKEQDVLAGKLSVVEQEIRRQLYLESSLTAALYAYQAFEKRK